MKDNSTGMPELKPCPFCGGNPALVGPNAADCWWYVTCDCIGRKVFLSSDDWKAVSRWNKRSDLTAASVQAGDVRELNSIAWWYGEEIKQRKALIEKHPAASYCLTIRYDELETLIAAASRQPEVVTLLEFLDLYAKHDGSYRDFMDKYPNGIRIVSKKEGE